MRHRGWLLAAFLLVTPGAWAQAGRFHVGERVVQPTTGETGTVLEINAANHQVRIRFDSRGAHDPGSWFFWATPDLQPSDAPPPGGARVPQAGPGGTAPIHAPAVAPAAHVDPPGGCRRPDEGNESPAATRGAVPEAAVKKAVEEQLLLPIGSFECIHFDWHGVEIGPAVRKDEIEGLIEGAPANTALYPVKVVLDYTLHSTRSNFEQTFERVAWAYFWVDGGHWAFGWTAHVGTRNRLRHP